MKKNHWRSEDVSENTESDFADVDGGLVESRTRELEGRSGREE